jgi:hypothetical protein
MPTTGESVGLIALLSLALKAMLLPAYRSGEFERHRAWLGVAWQLPRGEWYFENATGWPLDYPPAFAYFEYALSFGAFYLIGPDALDLRLLPAAQARGRRGLPGGDASRFGLELYEFQRLSVIVMDSALLLGILLFCATWPSVTTTDMAWSRNKVVVVVALILFNPGLVMVDHVFLHYSGFAIGILFAAVAFLRRGDDAGDLIGAAALVVLLTFDHTFVGVLPLFAVYLFRHFCFTERGSAEAAGRQGRLGSLLLRLWGERKVRARSGASSGNSGSEGGPPVRRRRSSSQLSTLSSSEGGDSEAGNEEDDEREEGLGGLLRRRGRRRRSRSAAGSVDSGADGGADGGADDGAGAPPFFLPDSSASGSGSGSLAPAASGSSAAMAAASPAAASPAAASPAAASAAAASSAAASSAAASPAAASPAAASAAAASAASASAASAASAARAQAAAGGGHALDQEIGKLLQLMQEFNERESAAATSPSRGAASRSAPGAGSGADLSSPRSLQGKRDSPSRRAAARARSGSHHRSLSEAPSSALRKIAYPPIDASLQRLLARPRGLTNLEISMYRLEFRPLRLAALMATVALSLLASLAPLLAAPSSRGAYALLAQLYDRLVPDELPLCRPYWAPNLWALYTGLDHVLAAMLHFCGVAIAEDAGAAAPDSELAQLGLLRVLPAVPPYLCAALALLAMWPALRQVWDFPHHSVILPSYVYCALCAFMLGHHVHEKSAVMIVVPLTLAACDSTMDARLYLLTSWVSHVSVLPILETSDLKTLKPVLLILHCFSSYVALDQYHIMARRERRIRPEPNGGGVSLSVADRSYFHGLAATYLFAEVIYPVLPFFVSAVWPRVWPSATPPNVNPFLPLPVMSVYCALGMAHCWALASMQVSRKVALIDSYQWSPFVRPSADEQGADEPLPKLSLY